MTLVNPGAASNNTTNVAHKLLVAWVDSAGSALVGPQGQNIPLAQGGVALSAGANSQSSGTINFSNANGVTFGMDGAGNITATVTPGAAAGVAAVQAGTQTLTSGTLVFSNSNGISFGMSNSSVVTASYTVPTQSVQTQASGAIAGTGFTSTTTGGVVIVGTNSTNGLSFGIPNYITTYVAQTTQTQPAGNIAGAGTTTTTQAGSTLGATQNSNGLSLAVPLWITTYVGQTTQTQPAGNIAGIGTTTTTQGGSTLGATLSTNGLSLAIPLWLTAAAGGGGFTGGVSTGGNTLGNTGTQTGQIVFAGGNNITLSVSTAAGGNQTITISGPNAGGAQTGISGIVVSNTTYTSGTVSFSNANGISFGSSAGQAITASYTVPTQTNQTIGIYGSSQTIGQSSSSTIDARSFSIVGAGIISVGLSAGSFIVSSPATTNAAGFAVSNTTQSSSGTLNLGSLSFAGAGGVSVGISNGSVVISGGAGGGGAAISAAGSSQNAGTVVFSNSNNVSFGMNGSTVTATATFAAQTNQTLGLYAVGNTTQNSSTTLDARTLSFDYLGAMTGGYSNGSIQISAPATSSISGTGLVSISVNGSTISIGVAGTTNSIWAPLYAGSQIAAQIGNGSIQVAPAMLAANISASRADILASVSGSTIALSTYAGTISAYVGLYTRNGSTLSLASSGSQSFAWTNSSNNNTTAFTGLRNLSVPINVNAGPQDLWIAVMSKTASANTNAWTASNMVFGGNAVALAGLLGSSAAATQQSILGLGVFSVSSASLPGSMAFSGINGTASGAMLAPAIVFHNVSA